MICYFRAGLTFPHNGQLATWNILTVLVGHIVAKCYSYGTWNMHVIRYPCLAYMTFYRDAPIIGRFADNRYQPISTLVSADCRLHNWLVQVFIFITRSKQT